MTPITADLLVKAVGCTRALAGVWADALADACRAYGITTPARVAAFLAQVGHESGGLQRLVENLNYSAKGLQATWPARFDAATAAQYARQPERIANRVYGGRLGNRPEETGDGYLYRGRGLVQVTGRANYAAVRDLLREKFPGCPNFVERPDALAETKWAALSAAAYWADHDLNELADAGQFDRITRRINGGTTGADDRNARYAQAKSVLA